MTRPDTRQTILDAAETLFAEQGFAATSLRQLTACAGVNLAAVNYHFGSKDDLAKAVLRRYAEPINAERIRRLDALARPAPVEELVRAFVAPVLQQCADRERDGSPGGGPLLPQLLGRVMVEQPAFLREFVADQFAALGARFVAMLRESVAGLSPVTAWWRLHFVVGAMAHTMQNARLAGELSGGVCDATRRDVILEQLVAFAVGGLCTQEVA